MPEKYIKITEFEGRKFGLMYTGRYDATCVECVAYMTDLCTEVLGIECGSGRTHYEEVKDDSE
jgi:hypothetical protein